MKQAINVKIQRESISEELRVLYVAMTRARDRLIMTYADRRLSDKLRNIAMRLDMSDRKLLTSEVDCPGDWVLQTALTRTEAGALFALGGHPNCAEVRERPWEISVVRADDMKMQRITANESLQEENIPAISKLSKALCFRYEHSGATKIPSKLTATQLKGRELDHEVADGTANAMSSVFRKASETVKTRGKDYGNAMHTVMQHISLAKCGSVNDIHEELERMIQEQIISTEQAEMIDCGKLKKFFASSIGVKLQCADNVLREFKFSILEDAGKFYSHAEGETILFQGVVDCALLENDGITIIDFKTDYVTEETIPSLTERYKSQVLSYANALSRIYEMPVKSAMLYFFASDIFVHII